MEVHFPPDVESRLHQAAEVTGRNAEELVRDTVSRMLANQSAFLAGVHRGFEQAVRGEFVSHQDVRQRVERLLQV